MDKERLLFQRTSHSISRTRSTRGILLCSCLRDSPKGHKAWGTLNTRDNKSEITRHITESGVTLIHQLGWSYSDGPTRIHPLGWSNSDALTRMFQLGCS